MRSVILWISKYSSVTSSIFPFIIGLKMQLEIFMDPGFNTINTYLSLNLFSSLFNLILDKQGDEYFSISYEHFPVLFRIC